MSFELIPFLTALFGSSIAALYDLKTTEVPDEIPLTMILIGVAFYTFQTISTGNFTFLRDSLLAGLSLLAFGLLLYFFGQWGGADALILSSIGFLLPTLPPQFNVSLLFPFPISYLFNLFFVGAVYMLFYAFVFALLNKRIFSEFSRYLKKSGKILVFCAIALFSLFFFTNIYLGKYLGILNLKLILINSILPLILTLLLFLLLKFVKIVESVGFKRKIPISKLKVGDVLEGSRLWVGITERELKEIKKSGKKFVVIKEGVRFAMAFPLALLFTLHFGDWILFFIK